MFELVQEIGRRSMLTNLYFSIFRNCKASSTGLRGELR